eukprot:gene41628-4381_t
MFFIKTEDGYAGCIRFGEGDPVTFSKNAYTKISDTEIAGAVKGATLGGDENEAFCGRFLMGWVTKAGEYQLAEVDGNCNRVMAPVDCTKWDGTAEWQTTKDGKVVWVHAYADENGEPKKDCDYGAKNFKASGRKDWNGGFGHDGYDWTKGYVTNEAR